MHLALNTKSATKGIHFSIFTDASSCLQALQKQVSINPKVRKLKQIIAKLQKLGKTVELRWVPRHVGFPGNDIADKKKSKKHQDDKKN